MNAVDPDFVRLLVGEYRKLLFDGSWPTGTPREAADICDFLIQCHAQRNAYFADCALLMILQYEAPVSPNARLLLEAAAKARLSGRPGGTPTQANRYWHHRTAYFYMAKLIYHGKSLEVAARMAAAAVDLESEGQICPKASTLERDYTARWRSTGAERAYFDELAAHVSPDDPFSLEMIEQNPIVTKEARIGKRR